MLPPWPSLVLALAIPLVLPGVPLESAAAQELRVMSFNIRYGSAQDGENAWPHRRGLVASVLQGFAPDVVGIQEALHFQLVEIDSLLPAYGRVGVGRDDGKEEGEYAAILYRTGRLELLDQGTFWFSDTPGVPGSMSWGNELPRICTWARFRDRLSGSSFLHFNVHWDHRSQPSRERAASLLLERVRETLGEGEEVVVTGDFNAGEENPAFQTLVGKDPSFLRDSFRLLHPGAGEVGTFHGFQGGSAGEKIDAVLVGPGWEVTGAEIRRDHEAGRYPSDHYPVIAVLRRGGGTGN